MIQRSGTETGSPYHAVLTALVATFALMVVDGASKIVAEQCVVDDGGILVMDEITTILPVYLCGMIPRDFSRAF